MRYERAPVSDVPLDYQHVVYPFKARDEFRCWAAMTPRVGEGIVVLRSEMQLL